MSKDLPKTILQKYLDSYPCKQCNKFKRYDNEMKNIWRLTGGHTTRSDEINHLMHSEYLAHIEEKHLPSKEEWEVLKKN